MHSLLRVARGIGWVVVHRFTVELIAARIASRLNEQGRVSHEKHISKEGTMTVFNAESVDLSHLGPIPCDYHPKGIHTEAIRVSAENIGKLSLEFEEELFYDNQGRPYFVFSAQRLDGTQVDPAVAPKDAIDLYVRVSDWIVPLRGELHLYREQTFQNTFSIDVGGVATPFDPSGMNDFAPGGRALQDVNSRRDIVLPDIKYVGDTSVLPMTGELDQGPQHRQQ